MELNHFRKKLVGALNSATDLRDVIQKAKLKSGSGTNYGDLRWVSVPLVNDVGSGIVSINVMPYRVDFDRKSGNVHYLSGEVQFVGCSRESKPKGPTAESSGDRLTLYPARYFPRLDRKKSNRKVREQSLTWEECFEGDQLSEQFTRNLKAFLAQLKAEKL